MIWTIILFAEPAQAMSTLLHIYRLRAGSLLMDRVLEDVSAAGYKKVMLWVFDENTRARRFYEAKGFKKGAKQKEIRGTIEVMYVRE